MEKIFTFFNFDDIGQKIKTFTKWTCWISILFTWITAPVAFLVCLLVEDLRMFCWVTVVDALVFPFVIWISSWTMYAFGELVDNSTALRKQKRQINPQAPSAPRKAPVPVEEEKPAEPTVVKTEFFDDYWICGKCKTKNLANRDICWSCGKEK